MATEAELYKEAAQQPSDQTVEFQLTRCLLQGGRKNEHSRIDSRLATITSPGSRQRLGPVEVFRDIRRSD